MATLDAEDVRMGCGGGKVWAAHPLAWIGLEPAQARALGARLLALADECEGEVGHGGIPESEGGASGAEGEHVRPARQRQDVHGAPAG